MAELYLAWRPESGRREVVVVKKILPHYASDPAFGKMFAREVELASRLSHPNLVAVYDASEGGPSDCYLAMEYVHGIDLSRVLRHLRQRSERMGVGEAVFVAMAMCAGLHHAHEETGPDGKPLGIVHRDVSPSNVLVSYDGQVKVTDFGVAKALGLSSFTQAGTRKGKLSYMSPEQARAEPVDRRTDVFAVGVVLFEMTTGERMFAGDNELAIIHNMLFKEPPRPSDLVRGYPPQLEEILRKAVAAKPEDRYDTALQLRRALQGFVRSHGGLPPSRTSLARLLEGLEPLPPHPASEPTFFDPDAELSIGRRDDTTTVDGHVPLTPAEGYGIEGPTGWGSMPESITGPSGHGGRDVVVPPAMSQPAMMIPAPSMVPPSVSAPMAVPMSLPPSSGGSMQALRRPEPTSSATATKWLAGALVVLATVVAGVMFAWLAASDDAPAPSEPVSPRAAEPSAPAPAPAMPAQPVVLDSGGDQASAQVDEPTTSPEPTHIGADTPATEAPTADPPSNRSRKRAKTSTTTKASKSSGTKAPKTAEPSAPPPPPTKKSTPPPPPPTKKSRKRSPTDTLLPTLGQ
jgi:serine/threonine protein kinase